MTKNNSLKEDNKVFSPNPQVIESANIKDWDKEIRAGEDIEKYWSDKAKQFDWFKKWDTILDTSGKPFYKWFVGGKINLAHNAVDRWIDSDKKDKVAILYVNELGDEIKLTYNELSKEVNKMANALRNLGIKKGDSVSLYLPMCPELVVTMVACTKIGAIHSAIYSGLSSSAVSERINNIKSKVVVTADGTYRRGKVITLKPIVDEAILDCPTVQNVVVVNHTGMFDGDGENQLKENDILFEKFIEGMEDSCECEETDAEDPLFVLYTSGSTGKPKGVLHTTGGYMVGIATTLQNIFDIQDGDIWWSTADAGWITGHSYTIYAPLLLGSTTLIFEGAPDYPDPGIWWKVIEQYGVTKFYTAPTAVRHLMRYGDEYIGSYDLNSIKVLGSVGEPINYEAWKWMYDKIGNGKAPIMDTWWQTETGMHMISPLPISDLKPGSATKPLPGVHVTVVDEEGDPVGTGKRGYLTISKPWPSMLRGLFNDDERYLQEYWSTFPDLFKTGDMAKIDEDGYVWIQGRSDDVLKISGHRIGAVEVEEAFNSHPAVNETAVIGKEDPVKGQIIKSFLILNKGYDLEKPYKEGDEFPLLNTLKLHVRHTLGPVAVLGETVSVESLPKTKSGKIMRRILKAQEEGEDLGDTSTLDDL